MWVTQLKDSAKMWALRLDQLRTTALDNITPSAHDLLTNVSTSTEACLRRISLIQIMQTVSWYYNFATSRCFDTSTYQF